MGTRVNSRCAAMTAGRSPQGRFWLGLKERGRKGGRERKGKEGGKKKGRNERREERGLGATGRAERSRSVPSYGAVVQPRLCAPVNVARHGFQLLLLFCAPCSQPHSTSFHGSSCRCNCAVKVVPGTIFSVSLC